MDDSAWQPPRPEPTGHEPTDAAAPEAPESFASDVPPAPGFEPAPESSVVDPAPASSGDRRSTGVMVGAGLAVVALVAAGVFAITRFTGESSGGASSPTELGDALLTAIDNEDVLGAIDMLLPGERESLGEPYVEFVSELTRLEVLAADASLFNAAGTDIALTDTSVTPLSTNVPDIVNIELHAAATVTVDGSKVELGDLVTDNLPPEVLDEARATNETTSDTLDITLTAVEQGDRWYFSLFHTAAELARQRSGLGEIPLAGVPAPGADTPEAAFQQLLDSITGFDLAGVIGALDPDEAAALQRYAPLFLDDAQASIDDAVDELDLQLEVTNTDVDVTRDGDQAMLTVNALAVSGSFTFGDEPVPFEASLDGDCFRASSGDNEYEQCGADSTSGSLAATQFGSAESGAFLTALRDALADLEPVGIELRQRDGRWYVSPIATVSEFVLKFLRALDRDEIDHLIELGTAAVGGGFADLAEMANDFSFNEAAVLESDVLEESGAFTTVPDSDPARPATVPSDTAVPTTFSPDASQECYSETDTDTAVACFSELVASGGLDPIYVPIALRFPECGYAELSWTGAVYQMPDAEFIAAVEPLAACFQGLVDSGIVQSYEVPPEFRVLDCFEGRNWYNTFDEQEYQDRVSACFSAAGA
jgi:hypothetical protein